MSVREALITKVVEAGGRLTVKSALNPLLWLCGVITIPALISFAFMTTPPGWLVWLAFMPVIAAIIGFFILLFIDRDKLQSENYQIRKMELEMIEQKGLPPIAAVDVEVIAEPESQTALLEEGKEHE